MSESRYPQLETLKKIRLFVLNTIKDLTVAELNRIPNGYSNNIIWNIAHLVAAQEGVCYKRSGQSTNISTEFFNAYKPGSKPERNLTEKEIEEVKQLLLTSVDQLENDLNQDKFVNYQGWTTRYDVQMNNIEDALNFLPFHEGMHLGYIMALKRNRDI
ncbi:DinB family protein [Pedobacter foliorum]|uniref:DinB family protein n=1 Tax=Pedobacter foliorum TaxID=2739058 RepID=UPI0015670C74|nr:DinB family protein [Pedobacter foliorum]NRF37361.1 DinB family protein [Pedobacter foliorum]